MGLALTGGFACATGETHDVEPTPTPFDFADISGLNEEYRKATQSFELPPGATWPPTIMTAEEAGGAAFQTGAGLLQAERVWVCAWMRELLVQDEDTWRLSRALMALEQVKTTTMYAKWSDDEFRKNIDGVLHSASLGDAKPAESFVDSYCRDVQ